MDLGILTYSDIIAGDARERSRIKSSAVPAHRFFAVSSGIGFDAAVCEEALTSRFKSTLNKLGLGKLTYLAIALQQLIAAKRVSCVFNSALWRMTATENWICALSGRFQNLLF